MGIGYRWFEKTKDINSPEFKQAKKDLVNFNSNYQMYLYLMSFDCLETEREKLRNNLLKD